MKKLILFIALATGLGAQAQYWQQEANYTMDITMDVENNTYDGHQAIQYTNNSPDTLHKAYFHLYFNAFQPGSMMDVRSRNIKDPDGRVKDRISKLNQDQLGYQNVRVLTLNGESVNFDVHGTVLLARLHNPILPGQTVQFDMAWDAQVPQQIRRSGRDNKEGIEYTMTQWYPKMAEYDQDGWHADQYVGREFYGVWGSFDVTIHINQDYVLGGTGVLQNPTDVGFGYAPGKGKRLNMQELRTWHFVAERVHDFAFAADPDFKHEILEIAGGPTVHLLYDPKTANKQNWKKIQKGYLQTYFDFMAEHFGKYPYAQFSIIQGGDGGMEYPMCTMMLGGGDSFEGFTGLFVHEATHNWYYGVIATNEADHSWMDEGFTTYAEERCMGVLFDHPHEDHFARAYRNYVYLDTSGLREPLSTPADHFNYNFVYGINSYSAGALFLNQLEYIVGKEAFEKGMKDFWNTWQFKHPSPNDFIRIMELASDLELDWYLSYYKDQVKSVDYAVTGVVGAVPAGSKITLENHGKFPMPLDVVVTTKDGQVLEYNIPLLSMYGAKEGANTQTPWPWTHPTYDLFITVPLENIESIQIDPTNRLLDIDRSNNTYTVN